MFTGSVRGGRCSRTRDSKVTAPDDNEIQTRWDAWTSMGVPQVEAHVTGGGRCSPGPFGVADVPAPLSRGYPSLMGLVVADVHRVRSGWPMFPHPWPKRGPKPTVAHSDARTRPMPPRLRKAPGETGGSNNSAEAEATQIRANNNAPG